ncbi:TPA: hypothetical protein HA251_04790 [Candidatus Woesearchaeota archaeon]|nr:hypothetical protein [Candidatus Woesearchaeota archaeon]
METARTETSADAQRLIQTIMDDARASAAKIDDDSAREVAGIDTETDTLVKAREHALLEEALRARDTRNRRENADVSIGDAKRRLARKHTLVNIACKKAEDAINKMPRKERNELLIAHWRHASTMMAIDHADVAHRDATFFARRTDVRTTAHWQGGFIAYAKGRRVSYDARFETLLADIRVRYAGDIAAALFGESQTAQRQGRAQRKKRILRTRARRTRSPASRTRRRA